MVNTSTPPILKTSKKTNTYQNNRRGFKSFVDEHSDFLSEGLIVLEPTGGYESQLGQINRKQIASLCGVAPFAKESGSKSFYRKTCAGRRNLRPILYMAAMGARRKKGSELALFLERLIKNGKKPLVALTAIMRKIVVIANARIKEQLLKTKENAYQH